MKKKSITILVSIFALLFSACTNEKNVAELFPKVLYQQGRLQFASAADFDQTIDYLRNNPNQIATWKKQFSGFVSMKDAYNGLTEADQIKIGTSGDYSNYKGYLSIIKDKNGEPEAVMNTNDIIFSQILSENGTVQIGNKGLRYTYNYKMEIANIDDAKYHDLVSATDEKMPSVIVATPIPNNSFQSRTCGNRNYIDYSAEYTHGGKKKRIKGMTDEQTYAVSGGVSGVGYTASTWHQVKNVGIWWADDADEIGTSTSGTACYGNACSNILHPMNTTFSSTVISYFATYTNSITANVDFAASPTLLSTPNATDLWTTHKAKRDDNGQYIYCYTHLCY